MIGVAAHADLLQRFHRTAALMLCRLAGQAESDIVDDGQMREQGVILEHQTDAAPLRRHAAGIVRHDWPLIGRCRAEALPVRRRCAAAWTCRSRLGRPDTGSPRGRCSG